MPRVAQKMYVIFDTVAETLVGSIMLAPNDLAAARAFEAAIRNQNSGLSENPRDYRMLRLGEVSDYGDVTSCDPSIVITGAEVVDQGKGVK